MYIFIGSKAAEAGMIASVMGHKVIRVSAVYHTAGKLGEDANAQSMWDLITNHCIAKNKPHPVFACINKELNPSVTNAVIADVLNEDMLKMVTGQYFCTVIGVGDVHWGLEKCDNVVGKVGELPKIIPQWQLVRSIAKTIDADNVMQITQLLLTKAEESIQIQTWKEFFQEACDKESLDKKNAELKKKKEDVKDNKDDEDYEGNKYNDDDEYCEGYRDDEDEDEPDSWQGCCSNRWD